MLPRDPVQDDRASSPLELFFDLVFTVAVAGAASGLYTAESAGDIPRAVLAYAMVFFTVWWAWVNFTWFSSAFDTDDWLYRVTTIVQMGGALVIAAGAGPAMRDLNFDLVTVGYVIVRLAMVAGWVRAAVDTPAFRGVAWRWAGGVSVVQLAWVVRMLWAPPGWGMWTFFALVGCELLVPLWAQRHHHIPWHSRHIAERYGLFTLIVLGESILVSSQAIIEASDSSSHLPTLWTMAAGGLILAACMWWVYFARPMHQHMGATASAFVFGYLHYAIFAAAGAFSAGMETMVRATAGTSEVGGHGAAATVTVPVAVFALGVWWLALRPALPRWAGLVSLLLILAVAPSAWLGLGIWPAAAAMIALVILLESLPHTPTVPAY